MGGTLFLEQWSRPDYAADFGIRKAIVENVNAKVGPIFQRYMFGV